jgi:hypothetical protein
MHHFIDSGASRVIFPSSRLARSVLACDARLHVTLVREVHEVGEIVHQS